MKPGNFLKGKKVLVAGGAGFLASNLILRLLEVGAAIRATFHHKEPQIYDGRIEYVRSDLTRAEDARRAAAGMEYVFMLAANTSGAAVIERTPLVHVTPNLIMNALMLEEAYAAGVKKFFFPSSSTVYPLTDHPVKEEEMSGDLFEKYFFVGWMKRMSEILCQMYAVRIKNPMPVVLARPANIYGPYDKFDWERSHVVPALIRRVVERHDPIEVWGDGGDIKDLIYVDDYIDGILLVVEKIHAFDPINIGTGRGVSVREVLEVIRACDHYPDARVVFSRSKPTMIPVRILDVAKAKTLLGFEAVTPLEAGIRRTVEWYRATGAARVNR